MHCYDLFYEDTGTIGLVMIEGRLENPRFNDYELANVECIYVV